MSLPGGRDQRPGERGDLLDPLCPTRQLLDRIGTKWTSMAVKVLAGAAPGEVRFAELRRRIPGISQKMLSTTLQSLVSDGLAARRVEPTVPPAVHYRLTELGLSLETPSPPCGPGRSHTCRRSTATTGSLTSRPHDEGPSSNVTAAAAR